MKKSTLSASISAAGAALLLSTSATAYDTWEWSGLSAIETHHFRNQPTPGDSTGWGPGGTPDDVGCAETANCALFIGTEPLTAQLLQVVTNKTVGNPPIAPGVIDPAAPSVVDCYSITSSDYDAAGNLVSGDIGAYKRVYQHLHGPTINPGAGGTDQNDPNEVFFDIFEFCTNEEGKLTDGYAASFVVPAGFPTQYAVQSYDEFYQVAFASGTVGTQVENVPTYAEVQAIIADVKAGIAPTPSGYGALNDWTISAVGPMGYQTCDITKECGQLNKSVPVPAFAAAALGLGLVGVTYLTGRRRTIIK